MAAPDSIPPRLAPSRIRRRALISLTPLIDVVFILLVFFMLASSFLDWRAIDLKAPAKAAGGAATEGALLIEIREDGLRLAAEPLTVDALVQRVRARLSVKPGQRVLIKPAEGVSVQRTVDVLDRLKAAGAANMSLMHAGTR